MTSEPDVASAKYGSKHGLEPTDYAAVQSRFESAGSNNLSALCTKNRLTPKENCRLFETPHIAEMIYLVLTGLRTMVV